MDGWMGGWMDYSTDYQIWQHFNLSFLHKKIMSRLFISTGKCIPKANTEIKPQKPSCLPDHPDGRHSRCV